MTVSEQIIQVIDDLCEKFGIAVNWTSENVIPYIELLCGKLVKYEIVTSIASLIFSIAIIILCGILFKKFNPIFKAGCERNSEECGIGWILGSVFAGIGLVILLTTSISDICMQVEDIIKCITFPELYVFEYVGALVQSA